MAVKEKKKRKKKRKKKAWTLETKLRQALRKLWMQSPMRAQAIRDARVAPNTTACKLCDKRMKENPKEGRKEWAVDHLEPAGSLKGDLQGFVDRLFYGVQRVLCRPCHTQLTEIQRLARKDRFEA